MKHYRRGLLSLGANHTETLESPEGVSLTADIDPVNLS
jgi:hypothetical protein